MIILSRSLKAVLAAGVVSVSFAGIASANAAASPSAEPAAAPAAPPIALSVPAIEAASAFRAFEQRAAAISPAFTNGAGVEQSLAVGSAYEPKQLSRGAIAYAALIALQDPTFVATLRVYAPYPQQRKALADRIVQDPAYAAAFAGAPSAAGLIVATLASQNGKITTVGAAVKQSAYSVQHSAWSKSKVIDPVGRLAKAKAESAALMSAEPDDVAELQKSEPVDGVTAAPALGAHGAPVAGPYAPVVARGLAVAALAILGEGGDDNDAQVEALLTEPEGGQCLNMAKLDLYQCLAVAGPWYEDIFCLGEHALGETSQCISKETATAAQTQAAVTPVSEATPTAAPVAQAMAAAH
jgi:hypothetical protein